MRFAKPRIVQIVAAPIARGKRERKSEGREARSPAGEESAVAVERLQRIGLEEGGVGRVPACRSRGPSYPRCSPREPSG